MKQLTVFIFTFVLSLTLGLSQTFAATEQEAFEWYSSLHQMEPKIQGLNEVQRERLFRNARYHKVASLEKLPEYDPSGLIGFCFGRAMTVHLLARKMGLGSASVRKLFVIGDLRSGPNPEWRFHVTTLVKGDDGEWWAVDPIMQPPLSWGGALKMHEWMEIVQRTWDKQKKAHFYMVDNSAIIPDLRVVPDPAQETGEKVIEISFNPKNAPLKFTLRQTEGRTYFESTLEAQNELFTNAFEAQEVDRFPFLSMRINGDVFDFNNYFVDLLRDLKGESVGVVNSLADLEVAPASARASTPQGLYSPNVNAWFR